MRRPDRVPVVGDRHRSLDFVLQLPHVTRPIEAHDHLQRLAIDPTNALAAALGRRRDDSVGEKRNVLGSLALAELHEGAERAAQIEEEKELLRVVDVDFEAHESAQHIYCSSDASSKTTMLS
jgi:hypothetical protein